MVLKLEAFEVTLANRDFNMIGGEFMEMWGANAMSTNRVNSLETDRMMRKTT